MLNYEEQVFFHGRISEEKFRTVLRLFCLDIKAKKVAEFTGLNRGTANNIFNKLREHISKICEAESPFANGEIELDESYFGARRVRSIKKARLIPERYYIQMVLRLMTDWLIMAIKNIFGSNMRRMSLPTDITI